MLIGITNTEQLHKLRDIYVSRYTYLGIWFNNSGSFNFAQNELYQKALKALFKLKSDFLVHNPEVKTSIHVFDHTIKPILLYGCEIWGYFNPFTSRLEMEIFQ